MCNVYEGILEEGRAEGRAIAYYELVKSNEMDVKVAAEKLGVEVDEFLLRMRELCP